MSRVATVDLFAEDRAHEDLVKPLVTRIAGELGVRVHVRTRSARGGHGKALAEMATYQRSVLAGLGGGMPDLLVAVIDANCVGRTKRVAEVSAAVISEFQGLCVPACPDPHIERWYLSDLDAFHRVVGVTPTVPSSKCERDFYKKVLSKAVVDAGYPPTLGGIEFARELAEGIDLYRAGRSESSLKHFVDELTGKLKLL